MSLVELLARVDAAVRPALISVLPPRLAVAFYSWARQIAVRTLMASSPPQPVVPPPTLERRLWGIRFRSPLFNAAGMFKHGEGYALAYRQGAGAYLAGTTTALPRMGNVRRGIALPFVPYPRSSAASNWLGLPNPGHRAVAQRIASFERYEAFPIGASVALDPGDFSIDALEQLLEGLWRYREAGTDFFELNESCPNTGDDHAAMNALSERLRVIAERFIQPSGAPVLLKISSDTEAAVIEQIVPLLGELGYAGVTIGNTSTQYNFHRAMIAASERRTYDYFVQTFGGGISGAPIRRQVVESVSVAARAAAQCPGEFHIIAVGGIANGSHVVTAIETGASLTEWYTGYFERFAQSGHLVYETLWQEIIVAQR
ncbi:MAG: hypothetical protein N2663_07955 [Chlorobi bacterium]|nr:hypothetical protein [Chlorobiota bacterium]